MAVYDTRTEPGMLWGRALSLPRCELYEGSHGKILQVNISGTEKGRLQFCRDGKVIVFCKDLEELSKAEAWAKDQFKRFAKGITMRRLSLNLLGLIHVDNVSRALETLVTFAEALNTEQAGLEAFRVKDEEDFQAFLYEATKVARLSEKDRPEATKRVIVEYGERMMLSLEIYCHLKNLLENLFPRERCGAFKEPGGKVQVPLLKRDENECLSDL